MFRRELKTRLLEDGGVEIVDPDVECLPLMKALDRDFTIRKSPLPDFTYPRFQVARRCVSSVRKDLLPLMPESDLWAEHSGLLIKGDSASIAWTCQPENATFLDIKIELCRRILAACTLCGRKCGINRLHGKHGRCGLGDEAYVAEVFTHIAEEPPINPSCNVGLAGCGLGCRFCQKHELMAVGSYPHRLDCRVWDSIAPQMSFAESLSFIGGNPDESLYGILKFLGAAPTSFDKPVVWNSNGYAPPVVYRLLDGIVDAYIPDAKFFSPICAANLAGAPDYFAWLDAGLAEMTGQKVPVIVRILVLPGHSECCHKPMIEHLARYSPGIKLNIMGQYHPDYRISRDHGTAMVQRPETHEVSLLREYARFLDIQQQ